MKTAEAFEIQLPAMSLVEPTLKYPDPGLLMMYKNLGHREIWLDDEINWDTCAFLVQYIQYLNRAEDDFTTPITIHIMSPGGELPVMFTIYDAIKNSRIPVVTINEGACHSAAFIVFLAGKYREMRPHALFIAHEGSGMMGGSYRENKSAMEQYEKDVAEMRRIIAAETGMDESYINKKFEESQDWYIRRDEAVEKGIIRERPDIPSEKPNIV